MAEVERLGDFVKIRHGWPFRSTDAKPAKSGDPRLIRIGNFAKSRGDTFRTSETEGYVGQYPVEFELEPRELLLAMTCQTSGGEILGWPMRVPDDGLVYLHNQRIGRVEILAPEMISVDYLEHLFKWDQFNHYLYVTASGSKILHTAPSRIEDFTVSLPPLDEQRRIAGVLGALDDLIDTNERLAASLDDLGMALYRRRWDHHTWMTVSDLGEVTMGQSPPGSTFNEEGDGIAFFQGVRDFGQRFPTERVYCTEPTRRAEAGDIFIAVRAPVGDTNIALVPTAIGRGLAALRAKHPATAFRALRSTEKTWSAHQGTGTVFSSINGKDLRGAKVPSVKPELVEETLATLDAQYLACTEEVETLRRTRDELLPLLMSGKVRVA